MNYLKVRHHALATAHLFPAREVCPKGGAQKEDALNDNGLIFQQNRMAVMGDGLPVLLPVIGKDPVVIFVVPHHKNHGAGIGQPQLAQQLRVILRHGVHVASQYQRIDGGVSGRCG